MSHDMLSPHIISYFFWMRRRAPSSTLFPYTTLFRSRGGGRRIGRRLLLITLHQFGRDALGHARHTVRKHRMALARQDRKSTRLNSSHMSISYAVFCLKNKRRAPNHMISELMMLALES